MQTLGIIGAGMIGSTIARLASAAGIEALLSNSRGKDTLADTVDLLGTHVRAASAQDAARTPIVIVAVPLRAVPTIPVDLLAGRIVIDTMNYYPQRDENITELDDASLTSSEWVQRHFRQSFVVKCFNSIGFRQLGELARVPRAADRSALPIAGDEVASKAAASALASALGYDTVDIGPLSDSWRSEPDTPIYCAPYQEPTPAGLTSQEEWRAWAENRSSIAVPAEVVRFLVSDAYRPAQPGGKLPYQPLQEVVRSE